MNASLEPISQDARKFLSSGKTIKRLRQVLSICADKMASSMATMETARSLRHGCCRVEYRVRIVKNKIGQFNVEMTVNRYSNIQELLEEKGCEE